MADEVNGVKEYSEEQLQYVYENRRYVGTKETVGFVLWDAAQSFNINSQDERFVTSILKVDLKFQTIAKTVNSIWDIVTDIFPAAIVEKTRTRWGKFRPYLMGLAIPGCILTILYWFMPVMFGNLSKTSVLKFVFYLALAIVREGLGTFQGIARTGLMATITPHPVDRTRLITIANFASGTFGEKLPEQILTIILDLIDNKKVADALGLTYGNYRTRNSRLSDKIHELASDIQNGVHPRLDNYHAMLANQIDECFGQLDTLLKSLYEKNLPETTHWETIQALRIEDQLERAKALQASHELDIPGARFSLKNPNGEVKYSLPTEPLNSNDDPQPSFCFEDDINFSLGKKKTTITFDQDSDKQEKTKSTDLFDFSDLSPRKTALKRFRESI